MTTARTDAGAEVARSVDLAMLLVASGLSERADPRIDLTQLRVDAVLDFTGGITPPPGPPPPAESNPDVPDVRGVWMFEYVQWTSATLERCAAAASRMEKALLVLAAVAEQAVTELAIATDQDASAWLAEWRAGLPDPAPRR